MAHKIIDDKVVVDWTTGDPEGDRIHLLAAYRDFIGKIISIKDDVDIPTDDKMWFLNELFKDWKIDIETQIDEVPRVWIKRPE